MPKIVNHDHIKERIAAAAWQVLLRDGLRGLTVRAIASEMQLSVGMLRHYFPKQEELLLFSMELVVQRVVKRLRAADKTLTSEEKLQYAAHQFLPLDADRMLEMEVWLQFVAGSRTAHTQALRVQTQLRVQEYFASRIGHVWRDNGLLLPPEAATECARILHALLDGLTLRYLAMPDEQTRKDIVASTERQLAIIRQGAFI